jgi:hypothetical protein
MQYRVIFLAFVVSTFIVGFGANAARADFSEQLITIEAVNADGRGTWQLARPQNPPDRIDYSHPDPILLLDAEQQLIGTIDDLMLHLDGDPLVNISFVATAGASTTTFTINSAVVSFPALINPTGNASAEVTLTDSSANGASMQPVSPNTGMFIPLYNGSTSFTQLLGGLSISSGGSVQTGGTGNQTIPGSVSSIQARYQFTLSATDVANGTGQFEVIPEPSTVLLSLCGLVGGVLVWRRRARIAC